MTQPHINGEMARVDQAHAEAGRFINSMLTDGVNQLQRGLELRKLFVWFGGSLALNKELTDTHLRVLLATAVGRLAVLHHAIEQLADQWEHTASQLVVAADPESSPLLAGDQLADARARRELATQVRKLVDDHG